MTDRSRQERAAIAAETRALEARGGEVLSTVITRFRTSNRWDWFAEVVGVTDGRDWMLSGYVADDGSTSMLSSAPLDPFASL